MFKDTEFLRVFIEYAKVMWQPEKKGRLRRHVNNFQGPNHLWHIDTNHKLVGWYFIIVGVVDGFSQLPISLKCCTSNKAESFNLFFKRGSSTWLPSRVYSDRGREKVLVADHMLDKWRTN